MNDCSSNLQSKYADYFDDVHNNVADKINMNAQIVEANENVGNHDFSISVASAHQICIQVSNWVETTVYDAKVTVTNPQSGVQMQAFTDGYGKAVFWVSDLIADETSEMQLNVRVEAANYRIRELQSIRFRSGETRTVTLDLDDGNPYVVMGSFDGGDILTNTNTCYASAANTAAHTFAVKLHCETDGVLELNYSVGEGDTGNGTVTKAFSASDSDSTVFVFEDQWLSKLMPDTHVSFTIKNGESQYTTQAMLVIQISMVDEPTLSSTGLFSLAGNSTSFDIPDEVPFIGGETLSLDLSDDLSQAVYLPSYQALYALGYDFKAEQVNWQTRNAEDEARAIKSLELKAKADEALAAAGAYRNINTTLQRSLLGERTAYITPYAMLKGLYRTDSSTLELSGTAGASTAFHADTTEKISVGPVSFYAGLSMDMGSGFGVGVASTATVDMTGSTPTLLGTPKISCEDENVSLGMNMRTTSVMGDRDDVKAEAYGYGSLMPTIRFTDSGAIVGVQLDMGYNVTLRTLFSKWNKTLLEVNGSLSHMIVSAPDAQFIQYNFSGSRSPSEALAHALPIVERLQPVSTTKLFDLMDVVADEVQFAEIAGDTFMFWIQSALQVPSSENPAPMRLNWYNLDTENTHGDVSYSYNSSARIDLDDYAFAVVADGNTCALTVLSGNFKGTGFGNKPGEPHRLCVSTLLMHPDGNRGLRTEYGQLNEELLLTDMEEGDYPILPGVSLSVKDSGTSVVSTYATSKNPEKINILAYDGDVRYTVPRTLTLSDEAEVLRCLIDEPTVANQEAVYALNAKGELSRLTKSGREVLAKGNIISFQVLPASQRTAYADRLFYLEQVSTEEGDTVQRLRSVTLDPVLTVTDYGIETCAVRFDILNKDGSCYLYWTEGLTPTESAGTEIQREHLVRSVCYDVATNTAFGPFTLVEFKACPNSVKLLADGTGCYTVNLQSSTGSYLRHSVTTFKYDWIYSAELTAAVLTDPCVSAGDYTDLVFSVKNTSNIPLYGLDVDIIDTATNQTVQKLHVDLEDPEFSTIQYLLGSTDHIIRGTEALRRISNIYDPLNQEKWTITDTTAAGTTVRSMYTELLMPGDTRSYQARVQIPADWVGGNTLVAKIVDVDGVETPKRTETPEGLHLHIGASLVRPFKTVVRLGSEAQKNINTDVHDLMLSAQLFQRIGTDYVHITLRNRSGNTQSQVTPVLTSTCRGMNLYSYTFKEPLGDEYCYSMDIPLGTLTQGWALPELELHVSGGDNAQYVEFADSDNHVRLLLTVPLYIVEQPESILNPGEQEVAFSVKAAGGVKPYSYQWQRMTDAGQWEDIPGTNEATYRIESLTSEHNNMTVRCVVTDRNNESVISNTATLGIQLSIVEQPESVSVYTGDAAAFSVAAEGGKPPYSYQWQRMNWNSQWENISGANQAIYSIYSASSSQDGMIVRCVVTDDVGNMAVSDSATLTVETPILPLFIFPQPESISVPLGQEAAFSVTAAGGEKPYRYQWQSKTGEKQRINILDADQCTYHIAAVKSEQNGLTVRCVVTDQYGDSVTSDSATLSLVPQTGDDSQLMLWSLLMLSCVAGMAMLRRRKRGC